MLILVYMVGEISGHSAEVDRGRRPPLQELVLVGPRPRRRRLVLVFVAGTWYLLASLITGREVFMAKWARFALGLPSFVVSWTVWSHHLLSDQAQPAMLKVDSGEW